MKFDLVYKKLVDLLPVQVERFPDRVGIQKVFSEQLSYFIYMLSSH